MLSGFVPPSNADDTKIAPVRESDILPYLETVISWDRAVSDSEPLAENAREILTRDKLKQNSKAILKQSFVFAHAQADILQAPDSDMTEDKTPQDSNSRQGRLLKAISDADQHAKAIQSQLDGQDISAADKEKLDGQLKLVKAQQGLLATMSGIFNTEGDKSGTLNDQINALSRTVFNETSDLAPSVKEEAPNTTKETSVKEKDAPSENAGMLSLSTTLFALSRKKTSLDTLADQSKNLAAVNRQLIDATRSSLREAIADGNALTSEKNDAKSLAVYRKSLDALIGRYKHLGAVIVPLGQISVLADSALRNVQQWTALVDARWSVVFHQLMIRLVILIISLVVPLALSGLAHRGIDRYVKDPKRRNQLRIARRIILGIALTFVILANFLTEFGSLATFAGFITAGLAVALQTVLISLVAHFLYFGRFGIRPGDRVSVSGVTGEVIQVGILRLYLRELQQTDNKWVPTGKVVAFPNSILFQPSAFYKDVSDDKY